MLLRTTTRRSSLLSPEGFVRNTLLTSFSSAGGHIDNKKKKMMFTNGAREEKGEAMHENPLLSRWSNEFELPPFSLIKPSHYKEAILFGFAQHLEEVQTIANQSSSPTFENTIAAFDRAGGLLTRVLNVFGNQCSSNTNEGLQAVQREMAAPLAEHEATVTFFPHFFDRVTKVHDERHAPSSGLNSEQVRLTERVYLDLVRAGAEFSPSIQERYKQIMMRQAELMTQFAQNVLADEANFVLELNSSQLEGLPDDIIEASKQAAQERRLGDGVYAITLSRSLVEPFLMYSKLREFRKSAWEAWVNRGNLDMARQNAPIVKEILELRLEQAQLHGYSDYASYSTVDSMAKTTEAVLNLLMKVWDPAKKICIKERNEIQGIMQSEYTERGLDCPKFESWDWRYYAERYREKNFDFDASTLKPYFSLDNMCEALFDCAHRLFGLKFIHRSDLAAYHPDVQVYEVHEADADGNDTLRAIFLHDNYSRANKQGGAWMSEYRSQCRNFTLSSSLGSSALRHDSKGGNVVPIIVNNNNFNKAPQGQKTLLSFDDAVTLFHEFGHGLHGMLSDVVYRKLSGTSVLRDFLELPSQLLEHWLSQPEVLKKHARHFETNQPIPDEYITKLKAAQRFNVGFDTVEYLSSALLDQSLHKLENVPSSFSVGDFERGELEKLGMPEGMLPRHRPLHFLHLFSCSSYASAYYVYLWAEVLDADSFDAFLEQGDIFHPEVAKRLRACIYSTGNSIDPAEAFRAFRGRDPQVEPMLRKKSLIE